LKDRKGNTALHNESDDKTSLEIRENDEDDLVVRLNCDVPLIESRSSLTECSIIDSGDGLEQTDITNECGTRSTNFGSITQLFVEK